MLRPIAELADEALDSIPVHIHDWVTMGAPLTANTPKPNTVDRWVDMFSDKDPVTMLRMFPPFPAEPTIWMTNPWVRLNLKQLFAARRQFADKLIDETQGMSRRFGIGEHTSYWTMPNPQQDVATTLLGP